MSDDRETEPMRIEGGPMEGDYLLHKTDLARPDDMKEREDERLRLVMAQAERHAADIKHQLAIATQQRDTLSRQVDSLVQRLAASHVAQGLIDMAAAQGFVQKEILPINQVLAQIAAQPQPEQST